MQNSLNAWPQKGLVISMNETRYTCSVCKDRGFILYTDKNGYEFARKCACQEVKEAKERLERSGLAREFKAKTFSNFDTCNNAQLADAKNTAMKFTEELKNKDAGSLPSLLLCGQVGAGKTHLGTACSVSLIDGGTAVIYMGYRDEMTALKAKILDEEAYRKEIEKYKRAPVLFIDDFLKGRITESDVNIVYEIVNYRYNNNLPVIISTEKTLDELINFDEAIASRLIEMCRGYIVVFSGKELNYRLYRGVVA